MDSKALTRSQLWDGEEKARFKATLESLCRVNSTPERSGGVGPSSDHISRDFWAHRDLFSQDVGVSKRPALPEASSARYPLSRNEEYWVNT